MKGLIFFVLSVVSICDSQNRDSCVVPSEFDGMVLGEDAKPGTILTSVSSENYANLTIADSAADYLEVFENEEEKTLGLRVSNTVSTSVDCRVNATLDDPESNSVYASIDIECLDTGEIGSKYPSIKITNVNNREPLFFKDDFELSEVVPSIPPEFSLSQLGYDMSDLFIYDLDHTGLNPTDSASTFNITMMPDDLFELIKTDEKKVFSEPICSEIKPELPKDIVALDLKLIKPVPADVPFPYVLTINVIDSNGLFTQGTISINFKREDRYPPQFGQSLYYATLMSVVFEGPLSVNVEPETVSAVDGDAFLNAPISYELMDGEFQEDNPEMNSLAPCVVQFQTDTQNPDFDNPISMTTLDLKTGELTPKVKFVVTDSDSNDTLQLTLLDGPGSEFFEINQDSELITSTDFDPINLPKGNTLNLVVQVQQVSNSERVSTTNIQVNYAYNFDGPAFNEESYYYELINPKPESDVTSEGDINALDTDNLEPPPTIDYKLSPSDYFSLGEPFSDGSPRVVYDGGAMETDIHILAIEAIETDAFPSQGSKTNIVIGLTIDASISSTEPADTTTTATPIVDRPAFEKPLYTKVFPNGYKPDTNCINVKALGNADDILYSIESVEDPAFKLLFEIVDPKSGTIACKNPSDITEYDETILITIRASYADDPDNAFDESIVLITVSEGDENEPPYFTSGDFGQTATQSVGYPAFIFLESFISMPLTRVIAIAPNSQVKIEYSIKTSGDDESSKFYVDPDLGFIYALPSKANDIQGLCPNDCTFMVQASSSLSSVVEIQIRIKSLEKNQVIGMEVKKDGETPAYILSTLNEELTDQEVWLRQIQYQPSSNDDRSLRDDQNLPVLFVSALNKDKVFADKDLLEALLENSDLVDVGYEYTIHSIDGNPADDGNSEALLIVVIVLAILFLSSVIGLVVFFFYFKRKRDAFMRDDSSQEIKDDDAMSRPNRFARHDGSPTKDYNKSSSVETDPKTVIYAGTNLNSQRNFDELNDQLRQHLSDASKRRTETPLVTGPSSRSEISFNQSPIASRPPTSLTPSTPKRRPAPPPPKASPAPKQSEGLDIVQEPSKLNENKNPVPTVPGPPNEQSPSPVAPPFPKDDGATPLDRKISFNESAEVIRVVAESKEAPIKEEEEENENESDGDES
ncbi:hypothetical protein TCAL_08974 [Tigriopus californicus]|uniref:Cadherin domain-containing protein n=1 Tax=Tigriopus californicus TaxID=6832 RepID=A0A553PMD2_TIGCA|nr:hypothetical protein TCAL_08974 [Tigriopus californicus]